MAKRVEVETLTLGEVSEMFQESFAMAEPKFNNWLQFEKKKLRKLKITRHRWINSYDLSSLSSLCHQTVFYTTAALYPRIKEKNPVISAGCFPYPKDTGKGGISINPYFHIRKTRLVPANHSRSSNCRF